MKRGDDRVDAGQAERHADGVLVSARRRSGTRPRLRVAAAGLAALIDLAGCRERLGTSGPGTRASAEQERSEPAGSVTRDAGMTVPPLERDRFGPLPCGPDAEACTPAQRAIIEGFARAAVADDCDADDRSILSAWLEDLPIDPRSSCKTASTAGGSVVRLELAGSMLGYVQDIVARRSTVPFTERELRQLRGECSGDGVPVDTSCSRTDERLRVHAVPPELVDSVVVVVVELEFLGGAAGVAVPPR
ncbi:MAG: hypothetical protein IPH07_21305 [Deltaproteobacteria bacterium]|nr:hypothetical protein [Deltaproteobacteria bacterium]MBP7288257.1 hypothetical protein [Nannocystaceae bacterium]